MKGKIRFEWFPDLSIVAFSAVNEIAKKMKEEGLDVDPKGESSDSSLKEGPVHSPYNPEIDEGLIQLKKCEKKKSSLSIQ